MTRLLFAAVISMLILVIAATCYVAWVTWRVNMNTAELSRVNEHFEAIDAWIDSRRNVAPADVLREIQSQHRELWTWLLTHGVNCPACPPCQSGEEGAVPGS